MSAGEIIEQINRLPTEEQKEVFVFLTKRLVGGRSLTPARWLGKKLSFEAACDVVFRENRELFSALAK